jgi:LuxR family maltose regulon positive regulatory protein
VVSFGPQLQWLRYHHLFADALQQQLADETEPGEIAALHHRAAEWLGENGHEEQALGHAIACQRWDVATALMHRICAPLTVSDRMVSMRYWLDLLPKDMVMGDPELRYLLLWSLAISADFAVNAEQLALIDSDSPDPTYQARTHSIRMQTSYALGDVDGIRHNALQVIEQTTPDMVPARINARISEATSRYLVGEFEEADDAFAEARRLIALEPEPWLEHRGELRYVDALCLQGRLDDAETLLGQIATTMLLSPQVADTQVGWFKASIHLERNELDLADVALAKAFDNAEATRADRWMPPILITRAMVDWARGNTGAAHTNAELARRTAKALGNPNFAQRAEALQAMMWIATGQHILAERWLATAALNLTWVREFNQPYPALAAVRLLVARGELEQALARLDEIITATRNYRRTGDLVRLHALKAGLLVRCNKVDHGARELATAIDLGAQGGFVRSFLDEGTAIAGLFNHPYIREHTHPHYAQSIKRAFDSKSVGLSHAHQSQVEALSLRELDVLRLVATGQSNRSIATSLFISEPTVKKHLSNIMSKLDVLNRTQAVSFAREMGLI